MPPSYVPSRRACRRPRVLAHEFFTGWSRARSGGCRCMTAQAGAGRRVSTEITGGSAGMSGAMPNKSIKINFIFRPSVSEPVGSGSCALSSLPAVCVAYHSLCVAVGK